MDKIGIIKVHCNKKYLDLTKMHLRTFIIKFIGSKIIINQVLKDQPGEDFALVQVL